MSRTSTLLLTRTIVMNLCKKMTLFLTYAWVVWREMVDSIEHILPSNGPSMYCSLGADSFCFPCKSVEVSKIEALIQVSTLGRVVYFSRHVQPEDVRCRGWYNRNQLKKTVIYLHPQVIHIFMLRTIISYLFICMSSLRVIRREMIPGKLSDCMYFFYRKTLKFRIV